MLLRKDEKFAEKVKDSVSAFLNSDQPENLILTLDGTGVNGSIQYLVLSQIGIDNLRRFKAVNVLSASTYAYLCFLAMHSKDYVWDSNSARGWDRFNRKSHRINRLLSPLRVLLSGSKVSQPLSNEGFAAALTGTLSAQFCAMTVRDLPSNVRIWLFEENSREFRSATPANELGSMKLRDIIRAAPAVPRIFAPFEWQTGLFSDPVYAPKARKFYQDLRSEPCTAHLFSNVFRGERKDKIIYVKPHPYVNGSQMLLKDMALFLCNLPNPAVFKAMKLGLYPSGAQ